MKLRASTSTSSITPRVFRMRLTAGVILINLAVVVVSGILLYQLREHDKNRIRIHTQNLSRSLEQSIVNIIEKSDGGAPRRGW